MSASNVGDSRAQRCKLGNCTAEDGGYVFSPNWSNIEPVNKTHVIANWRCNRDAMYAPWCVTPGKGTYDVPNICGVAFPGSICGSMEPRLLDFLARPVLLRAWHTLPEQ